MEKLSVYAPSAFMKLGHPEYVYETLIRLNEFYNIDLYVTKDEVYYKKMYSEIGINILNLKNDKNSFEDSPEIKKEYKNKFGVFSNLIYGIKKLMYYIRILRNFFRLTKGSKHIYFMEFEYISMYLMAFLYPKLLKKTTLVLHTSDFSWVPNRSKVINIYKVIVRRLLQKLIKSSKGFAVHGEVLKDDLIGILGNEFKNKIFVSGYGFNKIKNDINMLDARRELKLESLNEKIFLMFGLIRKDKGFPEILKHFSNENIGSSKLVVAGDIQDVTLQELNDMIDKYKLKDNIILRIGYIEEEDIKYYFAASDYVILSHQQHFSSFSGPFALSMQYKKPVICSNSKQVGEIVLNNNLGYIYKDEESLIDAIKKSNLSKYNYDPESNINYYTWDSAADRIKKWLKNKND